MLQDLLAKDKKLAVIGLGYVGLPIALLFAQKVSVIGFDINSKRVAQMREGIDPSRELPASAFEGCDIHFTDQIEDLKQAQFFIVAVPTPIDEHNQPDLTPVLRASETVAKVLKPGDYVVYESTVYPGCTEEDCVPILEKSGLKFMQDFKVGYSPERINPGDHVHTIQNTIKIVSGCGPESAQVVYDIYSLVINAGLHLAATIKVAEAAKIIENTQRDLNIALMNELSIIFDKMNINTYDVIEAAGTKWNFQKYYPGLVGGHCIGVDPYYLTFKANALGYHSKVILAGRDTNDSMAAYVGNRVAKKLIEAGKILQQTRVLVLGITFKENVSDIRNSKVVDLVNELKSFQISVDIVDPWADAEEVQHEYQLQMAKQPAPPYDAVIVAVAHQEFIGWMREQPLLVDIKGIYKHLSSSLKYWSL
jgi:UDP-N-acetyl-D-glucosamine/UDP-N-acetyl-D-galactosamine dehydrogenase